MVSLFGWIRVLFEKSTLYLFYFLYVCLYPFFGPLLALSVNQVWYLSRVVDIPLYSFVSYLELVKS